MNRSKWVLLGAALDDAANEKPELGRGLRATFHHVIVGCEGPLYGLHCWHLLVTEVPMLPEIYRPRGYGKNLNQR